ncbi:MAG: glycosyltransferase [Acidobacteriota bacterium]|nr:glycosyltransferase [Acidobacteriota bacterium]
MSTATEHSSTPPPADLPRLLVWTWTDPDFPSGSPAILAALLDPLPAGKVEVVCEDRTQGRRQRLHRFRHPVHRYRLHQRLWPFRRGSRIRTALAYLCAPCLLLYGLWRIYRFRPGCLLTVYHQPLWIFTSYLLSKLTGVPVVYYVHDPYRQAAEHRGRLEGKLAAWIESRTLHHGLVVALSDYTAELYRQTAGIEARVLPHVADLSWASEVVPRPHTTGEEGRLVGYAGTIYENNQDLMKCLASVVEAEPRLCLRVWTPARQAVLEACGLLHPRIEIRFESDHQRLLEELSQCDLLYLPLSFHDSPSLPTDSLRYALPTKVVDYCLAGAPTLVHCPEDYATARFFRHHEAGFLLHRERLEDLRSWIKQWLDEDDTPSFSRGLGSARATFDPSRNHRLFREYVREAAQQDSKANQRQRNEVEK